MGEYYPYYLECPKCGREILLEIISAGANHIAHAFVACKECIALPLPQKFVDELPEFAQEILAWSSMSPDEFDEFRKRAADNKMKDFLTESGQANLIEKLIPHLLNKK